MSDQTLEIIQKSIIPAPIDQVWDFLRNNEKMKTWFNANEFVIDAMEGGKVEIPVSFGNEELMIEGEIGLVQPKEKFVFTWLERDRFGDAWFNNTSITIEIEKNDNCTNIKFKHDGFKYLPEEDREGIFKRYFTFWEEKKILSRLKSLIYDEN